MPGLCPSLTSLPWRTAVNCAPGLCPLLAAPCPCRTRTHSPRSALAAHTRSGGGLHQQRARSTSPPCLPGLLPYMPRRCARLCLCFLAFRVYACLAPVPYRVFVHASEDGNPNNIQVLGLQLENYVNPNNTALKTQDCECTLCSVRSDVRSERTPLCAVSVARGHSSTCAPRGPLHRHAALAGPG